MRASEFVELNEEKVVQINIPINITIPSDGSDVEVETPCNGNDIEADAPVYRSDTEIDTPSTGDELNGDPDQDIMVPPLQQDIELEKADAGKESEVIDQLTQDEAELSDEHKTPLAYKQ